MQRLIEAARAVMANWERGDLAAAVRELAAALPPEAPEAIRDSAAELYAGNDIEIDDVAYLSEGDGGTWVSAWVWMPCDSSDEENES
jgi:hypothetical protein